jgi:UDP-N-acetylglucosamine--N-acetylmuramyl-(pentapeptide) pyrophosphoryl-undecaprenol N-acetylglucosamine transferase
MRVLIVAGGTGGHIFPGLAIASYLKENIPNVRVLWVGGSRDTDSKVLSSHRLQFTSISMQSWPRKFSAKQIDFAWNFTLSFFQTFFVLIRFRPHVVVGMGSYHSFPAVILSYFLGIKSLICEQNINLSLTNRFLARFASRIAISFPQTKRFLPSSKRDKFHLTGNPIRPQILKASKEKALRTLGLKQDRFTLFFLGGSQGAHTLNRTGIETINLLKKEKRLKNIQVIFITGRKDLEWVREYLKLAGVPSLIREYLSQIQYAYAAADLVICRSGATTLAEITGRGLPAILIPYPYATDCHQMENARYLETQGAAYIISEKDLAAKKLMASILKLLRNRDLLKKMGRKSKQLGRPRATEMIASLIQDLGKN